MQIAKVKNDILSSSLKANGSPSTEEAGWLLFGALVSVSTVLEEIVEPCLLETSFTDRKSRLFEGDAELVGILECCLRVAGLLVILLSIAVECKHSVTCAAATYIHTYMHTYIRT